MPLHLPTFTQTSRETTIAAALGAGFDHAGIAAVPMEGSPEELLQRQRFREWVDAGRAGEMAWLTRRDADGELVRSSLQLAVPWVRSVVICAKSYHAAQPLSTVPAPEGAGWIARYAWSGASDSALTGDPADGAALQPADYHDVLLTRLRAVEAALLRRYGTCRRAVSGAARGRRLDWQEHLHPEPAAGIVPAAGCRAHIAAAGR